LPALAAFLRRWRPDLPLCVEVRHPSWFVGGGLLPGVRDLLEGTNVGTVITDVAGRRDVCHGSLTARFVVVRFVATAEPERDSLRADEWVDALFGWRAAGLGSAFLFVHAPDDRLAPAILAHVVGRARAKGAPLSALSLAPGPRQLDLFGA
jgi:uncharacterized protein YecE (DUF72 family)